MGRRGGGEDTQTPLKTQEDHESQDFDSQAAWPFHIASLSTLLLKNTWYGPGKKVLYLVLQQVLKQVYETENIDWYWLR